MAVLFDSKLSAANSSEKISLFMQFQFRRYGNIFRQVFAARRYFFITYPQAGETYFGGRKRNGRTITFDSYQSAYTAKIK